MEVRLRLQTEVVTKALRKSTPSAASRSISAVCTTGFPMHPSVSQRWSSLSRNTMLGGETSAATGVEPAPRASATRGKIGSLITPGLLLLEKDEDAHLVAHDDVHFPIAIDVTRGDLRSDTGAIVDQVRNELGAAFSVSLQLEPVEDGRGVGLEILEGTVCPAALAGDEIHEAVSVDVGGGESMGLRKLHAMRTVFRLATHETVPGERPVLVLFVPAEAVAVGIVARDDVVSPIAVDVENEHVGTATLPWRNEGNGMLLPEAVPGGVRGLLEPSLLGQDVRSIIAVHISKAIAVGVAKVFLAVRLGDRSDGPEAGRGGRIGPIDLRVAEAAPHFLLGVVAGLADEFRLP